MKTLLKIFLAVCLLSGLRSPVSAFAQSDGYAFLCDTNGNALSGFYLPAAQLTGTLSPTNIPTGFLTPTNTSTAVLFTNHVTAAFTLLTTNAHLTFIDEYGTTNSFTTNGFSISFTNGQTIVFSNGNLRVSGTFTGNGAGLTNVQITSITNWTSVSNTLATSYTNFWWPFTNIYCPWTNWVSTNFSALVSNVGTGATNDIVNTSNQLTTAWNYTLTTASNNLATATTSNLTFSTAVSNLWTTGSNTLAQFSKGVSNIVAGVSATKALTATLPATYASIGIGFSTPLMPDGNYSVTLLPQDQTTADAHFYGMHWWVDTKNSSGFTLHVPFATNAFNLNFDCLIKENTQ
jgi:hypothetical protein